MCERDRNICFTLGRGLILCFICFIGNMYLIGPNLGLPLIRAGRGTLPGVGTVKLKLIHEFKFFMPFLMQNLFLISSFMLYND